MKNKPTNHDRCQALKNLMVLFPVKQGLTLRSASKQCGIDLYKYRKDSVIPLTLSLFTYGEAFNIQPCWLIKMADWVAHGEITEEQALKILANWPEYEDKWESILRIVLKEAVDQTNPHERNPLC